MRDLVKPIISGIISGSVVWILKTGADKMPDIARSFLATFWPLLVAGAVFLIHWNIQFFRVFRKEKEREFQVWLEDQDRKLLKEYERRFNDMYRETKDAWETARDVVERCHEVFERRISRLEHDITQMKPDRNP